MRGDLSDRVSGDVSRPAVDAEASGLRQLLGVRARLSDPRIDDDGAPGHEKKPTRRDEWALSHHDRFESLRRFQ